MSFQQSSSHRLRIGASSFACLALLVSTGCQRPPAPSAAPVAATNEPPRAPVVAEATSEQVHQLCGACHAYPPPDILPRSEWRREVARGFKFFEESGAPPAGLTRVPPLGGVIAYYEQRAPEVLPALVSTPAAGPPPVRFERYDQRVPGQFPTPAVSHVNLVHLSDPAKLDLVVCDMRAGRVFAAKPYERAPAWRLLGKVSHPARAEVVDLNGDGVKDLLVADLGNFVPTNDKVGRVVWLRGKADGTYTPVTLLPGVGRVADVQAADFDGDGDLDLIVAVFGWTTTGEILYLENRTTDWDHPVFVPHVLDRRHGTIHVPVCDLNNDGKPDFVALISQEHEAVVAFFNEGGGRFRQETIYAAPHPAVGSTGIQLVDLDGDGDLDVLLTHGDVLDERVLKPYHGVLWLENRGSFPFTPHRLASLYGAHRAVAADLDGDGDLDIVAVSFLPPRAFPDRKEKDLDAVILLEQTAPGTFVRHSLETATCDHVCCALGAWDGDGRVHFVTGNFCIADEDRLDSSVALWKNLTPLTPKVRGGSARNR